MALSSPHIQRFLLCKLHSRSTAKNRHRNSFTATTTTRSSCCSAIAIDAPSSLTEVPGIRWGSIALQGLREEMEDDIIVRPEGLQGFTFAAVFDGHGGFSSVEFLRDELYKECVEALQGGLLLVEKDFKAIKRALQEAFLKADARLLKRLEMNGEEDESGATSTAVFIGDDELLISHIGDSSAVLCRSGKAEVLTSPHRPIGSSKTSLHEIRRVREAGGWKCGCLEEAWRVFHGMTRKSLITWNTMVTVCANYGNADEAFRLFEWMVCSGVVPDSVTLLALLVAYAHKGLVDEGIRLFESMDRDYGVEPRIEHYGAVIDMLGRAGRLQEAYDLLTNIPIPCNDAVWGALLGACRIHGDVEMGEKLIKKLLELKPDEGGYYILLRDIYVAAGQTVEANETRQAMLASRARKNPGCSWVEG